MDHALNAGHRAGCDRGFCRYTVYDRKSKSGLPLVVDAPARICARWMGIALGSFYCAVSRCRKGVPGRWEIVRRFVDEEAMDEEN